MSYTYTPVAATKSSGAEWAAKARAAGFKASAETYTGSKDAVVTLRKSFEAGDAAAYRAAESEAYSLLGGLAIVCGGTTWGTTSDGVGGHVGLTGGYVEILRSGVSRRFASGI